MFIKFDESKLGDLYQNQSLIYVFAEMVMCICMERHPVLSFRWAVCFYLYGFTENGMISRFALRIKRETRYYHNYGSDLGEFPT